MILSDRDILKRIRNKSIIVSPFVRKNLQPSTLDVRLAREIRVFNNYEVGLIDVKKPVNVSRTIKLKRNGEFVLHPGEFILGSTVEKIALPDDIAAKIEGRSSLGRLGLIIHATAGYIDPGFSGFIYNFRDFKYLSFAHKTLCRYENWSNFVYQDELSCDESLRFKDFGEQVSKPRRSNSK
jgi:deoxycytidine triphosphate deaminase